MSALLEKIDLNNYHATQEGMKTYMKQIQEKTKKLRNLDLINNEENKLKNISNLANILNNEEIRNCLKENKLDDAKRLAESIINSDLS